MNIDKYSFDEFKQLAERFHGYAAPGLLLGGYMVALAKRRLPEGTLFEAVSETSKCLPDAVQMLSLCSMGNNWLKVRKLGRYAVTLYDKFTGRGVRVGVSLERLRKWPEYYGWLMKLKPKKEQDTARLMQEIEEAGDSICTVQDVIVFPELLGRKKSFQVSICPGCGEGYPTADGPVCRASQGEGYFHLDSGHDEKLQDLSRVCVVPAEESAGKKLAQGMTGIVPGESKDHISVDPART